VSNSSLSSRLSKDEFAIGSIAHINDPAILELIALAGFDWASFTLEHATPSVDDMLALQRTADLYDLTTLLHVPSVDDPRLLAMLHTGIGGICLQQAQDRAAAEALVRVCTYPPRGERGAHGGMRADRYGSEDYDDFMTRVNETFTLGVAIENLTGVENAAEILAVEGISIVFVGLHDLSHSVGVPNQLGHPEVLAALAKVSEAAQERGVPLGLPGYAHSIAELKEFGAQMAVSPGNEYAFIRQAFKDHVDRARQEAGDA
jgi:2-keto-3-deoxy-L-rhamnonate aldolase RhmA